MKLLDDPEHLAELMRRIRRIVHNPEISEDILQDTIVHIIRAQSVDSQRAWNFKIAANLALDYVGSAPVRHNVPISFLAAESHWLACDPAHGLEDEITNHQAVQDALALMKDRYPKQYELLISRYYHGLSYRELADGYHLSLADVKITLFRAHKHLKYFMKEDPRD